MNRTAWTLASLAGLAGGYYLAIGRLHQTELSSLRRGIDAAYTEYDLAEAESVRAIPLQQVVDDLGHWQAELQTRLDKGGNATPPLLAVRATFLAQGLAVERSEALPGDTSLPMRHQRLRLVVAGSFPGLFEAIRQLEDAAPPARVTELRVTRTAGTGRIRAEMTIVRTEGSA
jgi:hypothetical protein